MAPIVDVGGGSGGSGGEDSGLEGALRSASAGDESAWRWLVRRYAGRVYALAKSRCGSADVADEIVQSVFATAAVKLRAGEYSERGRFEPWLFRVTMNRLRDEMRRVRRQATPTDPIAMRDLSPASPDARPGHAEPSSLDRLRRALHELSPQDREIIELRHHGGLSFNQLSELLDEPLGTLLARHHRALKKLQAILSPHGRDRADEEHDS